MSVTTAFALALALSATSAAPDPGDGGVGDFYVWKGPVTSSPGRLLRQADAIATLPGAATSRRILYSSRSGHGGHGPIAVSGSVYLPRGTAPKGGWPVIAWAHGTTGTADVCAPSSMGWSSRDTACWLSQGYAVVATDYEGLGGAGAHPYMATRSQAQSVLDSVRAARDAERSLSARTVIVGQSQGAHAAIGAGLMAARYAPQIDLRGVVVTGVPGLPVEGADARLGDTIDDGVRAMAADRFDPWMVVYLAYFSGYGLYQPDFRPADYLTPRGMAFFRRLQTECHAAVTPDLFKARPLTSEIFTRDPSPVERAMMVNRIYPSPAFKAPLFVGIGLQDEQTSPEGAFAFARSACARRSAVTVRFYPGKTHSGAVLPSQADSIPFVRDAFAGRPLKGDCATLAWPGRS